MLILELLTIRLNRSYNENVILKTTMPKMKARRCYWQNLLFTGRTGLWQYRKAPVHGNVYPRDYEDVSSISKVTYGSDLQLPIRTFFWLQKLVTSYSNSHFVITLAHVTDILQGERISEYIVFLRYLTLIFKYLDLVIFTDF